MSTDDRPLVVYGAGGHGKVIADALLRAGARVKGFVDDGVASGARILGLPVLGPSTWLEGSRARVALGVGSNAARRRVMDSCQRLGCEVITVVHPQAVVASSVTLEEGSVILALAVINADAIVQRGAIVNSGAIVEHDCRVGAFAHVSPNATLAGASALGELSHLGAGAVVLPGIVIGDRATVGAGAVVTRNISDDIVATGVPARPLRKHEP